MRVLNKNLTIISIYLIINLFDLFKKLKVQM